MTLKAVVVMNRGGFDESDADGRGEAGQRRVSVTVGGSGSGAGTLDASGLFGGIIELYGKSSVDVEGSLLARGSDPEQLGGTLSVVRGASGGTVIEWRVPLGT